MRMDLQLLWWNSDATLRFHIEWLRGGRNDKAFVPGGIAMIGGKILHKIPSSHGALLSSEGDKPACCRRKRVLASADSIQFDGIHMEGRVSLAKPVAAVQHAG